MATAIAVDPAAAEAATAATLGKPAALGPAVPLIVAEAVEDFSELGPRDVHPWHRPAQPSHEAIKASPHRPVFVTANPMAGEQVRARAAPRAQRTAGGAGRAGGGGRQGICVRACVRTPGGRLVCLLFCRAPA